MRFSRISAVSVRRAVAAGLVSRGAIRRQGFENAKANGAGFRAVRSCAWSVSLVLSRQLSRYCAQPEPGKAEYRDQDADGVRAA